MAYDYVKADRSKQKGSYGYDEMALRSAIAMAGVRGVGAFLAHLTGHNNSTCFDRLKSGAWTRLEIARIIDALQLTDEQVFKIFFNGKTTTYEKDERYRYTTYRAVDDPRRGNKPLSVAEKLDETLKMVEEEREKK